MRRVPIRLAILSLDQVLIKFMLDRDLQIFPTQGTGVFGGGVDVSLSGVNIAQLLDVALHFELGEVT